MFNKDQLIASLAQETKVIKHLHSKIVSPEHYSYRPAKEMRSMIELLQYLSMCAIGPAKSILADNWDIARTYRERAATLTAAEIPAALDEQLNAMKNLISEIDDSELVSRQVKFPWGGGNTLGAALIDTSLKFITAYKMQLFVYLKSAGIAPLVTSNCWRGEDMPKPS